MKQIFYFQFLTKILKIDAEQEDVGSNFKNYVAFCWKEDVRLFVTADPARVWGGRERDVRRLDQWETFAAASPPIRARYNNNNKFAMEKFPLSFR